MGEQITPIGDLSQALANRGERFYKLQIKSPDWGETGLKDFCAVLGSQRIRVHAAWTIFAGLEDDFDGIEMIISASRGNMVPVDLKERYPNVNALVIVPEQTQFS